MAATLCIVANADATNQPRNQKSSQSRGRLQPLPIHTFLPMQLLGSGKGIFCTDFFLHSFLTLEVGPSGALQCGYQRTLAHPVGRRGKAGKGGKAMQMQPP